MSRTRFKWFGKLTAELDQAVQVSLMTPLPELNPAPVAQQGAHVNFDFEGYAEERVNEPRSTVS